MRRSPGKLPPRRHWSVRRRRVLGPALLSWQRVRLVTVKWTRPIVCPGDHAAKTSDPWELFTGSLCDADVESVPLADISCDH